MTSPYLDRPTMSERERAERCLPDAKDAEITRLRALNAELVMALEGMTHGLPELLESIGYADEEGMIEKALCAINKAEESANG